MSRRSGVWRPGIRYNRTAVRNQFLLIFLFSSLFAAGNDTTRRIAYAHLSSQAAELQLEAEDLAGVFVYKEYRSAVNGVTHIIYKEAFQGLEVANAEWVVNIDRDGRVLNAGGSLYGRAGAQAAIPQPVSAMAAVRSAAMAVNLERGQRFVPFGVEVPKVVFSEASAEQTVRFARGEFGADLEGRSIWYAAKGELRPAWEFFVLDSDQVRAWNVVVDSETSTVLAKDTLTFFQNAPRGLVFEMDPQPNPMPGVQLKAPPPYVQRRLLPFTGDPTASPHGWVTGNATAGNNAIIGINPNGVTFATAQPTTASNGDFSFPLELGPGAAHPHTFPNAANTNLFYWINRSHDLFYQAGFDEAAGNYQEDNFGRGGAGADRMTAYTQYGSAGQFGAALNNAFYSTRRTGDDGAPAMIAMFLGIGDRFLTDGAYDSNVILHEYTHGVSLRLVRQLAMHQGGAMGEAWSDFFALEFGLPEGTPPDGTYPAAEYLFQQFGTGIRTYPYSTNKEVNPITYADLGHVASTPAIHQDGGIWVAALWEMRANLIRQFGEREGRRRTRILVIEGMKLTTPRPTMVDARDAVLLADRVTFNGQSQRQIWEGFAKRGLGVLAFSTDPDSIHVAESHDMPSPAGAIRFFEDSYVAGETVRILVQDENLTVPVAPIELRTASGDEMTLNLRKTGNVYVGTVPTAYTTVVKRDAGLSVSTADFITAYYTDYDTGGGRPRQVEATVPASAAYQQTTTPRPYIFSGETRLGLQAPSGVFLRYSLPFEFPFYGKKYSTVRVYSNGLLSFDAPAPKPCYDTATLRSHVGTAPMWMALRTNGTAQPNEDVYVTRLSSAVAFRWVAETENLPGLSVAEPVNFSATLWDDGRIEFQYGTGNRNLSVVPDFSGCGASTPTVGISNGHETLAQTSILHQGFPNLEHASSITFHPQYNFSSLPQGLLQSPQDGETYAGLITGRAVIWDGGDPMSRVEVYIDGELRAFAGRVSRPDFCAARQVPGCPLVGWDFTLDPNALRLSSGPHTVRLRAVNLRGGFTDIPENPVRFLIEDGEARKPVAVLEAPEAGTEITAPFTIRGYAHAPDLRVIAVEVLLDGLTIGRTQYGLARAEICRDLSPAPPNCPAIGFTLTVNPLGVPLPIPNGEHKLQLRVIDQTGRMTVFPEVVVSVRLPDRQPPVGALTLPLHNDRISGMVRVSGQAWDPDGRVTLVQLLVDGVTRATVPYGAPRPEACSDLIDVPLCPNIGFQLDYDTRQLLNGPHVLGVRVIDNQGNASILPAPRPNANGITVVVQN